MAKQGRKRVYYTGECPRCGVDAPERRNPLCIDCRYVLSPEEAALWLERRAA